MSPVRTPPDRTPGPRRRLSLSTRLVVTVVALLGVLAVAIGGAAALGLRSYLLGELDANLARVAERPPRDDFGAGCRPLSPRGGFNQAPDTLTVGRCGGWVAGAGSEANIELTNAQTNAVLAAATVEGSTIEVDGLGTYRVRSTRSGSFAFGMPTAEVTATVTNLIVWEAVLTVAGLLVAALVGRVLVRRQLAPLRDVAATARRVATTPMASGAVPPVERVSTELIGSSVEVGQVGAALNTLLDHVESSLTARHASEQQVRQFVADASHELRTPLATVRGYSELARRNPDDAAHAQAALEKVQQESARMSALVEDLLLLARLDQGRPLEAEPVDLRGLVVQAVVDAQVLAPDHRWNLDLGTEEELETTSTEVVGDAMRLHQVVSNLVTNAWRHTPEGTRIEVSVRATGTGVRLTVSDNGPGVGADLLPHVFERFTRGDKARTRGRGASSNGTGLGLSTVRAIVTAHGGTVVVRSIEGEGSRFVVDLPPTP